MKRIATFLAVLFSSQLFADPCGMVPPIYDGPGVPLARTGDQQTYVFFKGGVESFVIRPGFNGKVEDFGMLIPFPTPPAVRKVPDHIFPHIAAAVDPPEVVIDVSPPAPRSQVFFLQSAAVESDSSGLEVLEREEVRVIRQEAVGMYEVAVLEAGSAGALKKWMDKNGYRFPDGMDNVCNDYVDERWCFVAIKTKVSGKEAVDPQPGQRAVKPGLPAGGSFDGFVQAMGFRFKTDELVVPMRLSAFNEGDLKNIVYLLTDGPRRIRSVPEEFVQRQIKGQELVDNLVKPLPLRIVNGGEKDLKEWHRRNLKERRDPRPKNGAARELFTADLVAVRNGELSLPHEEQEKQLLKIGERLGLRGDKIDALNAEVMSEERAGEVARNTDLLKDMTLTVVDGDFPREVISKENLTFAAYNMPAKRNSPYHYDGRLKKARPALKGNSVMIRHHVGEALPKRNLWRRVLGGLSLFGVALLFCSGRRR